MGVIRRVGVGVFPTLVAGEVGCRDDTKCQSAFWYHVVYNNNGGV